MTDRDRHRTQGYKTRAPEEPTPLPVEPNPEQVKRVYHSTYMEHVGLDTSAVDAGHLAVFNAGVEAERARAAQIAREEHVDAAWLAEDKAREERAAALATAREREADAWAEFVEANRTAIAAKVAYTAASRARQALEDAE
jgi:hypothetical protein